MLLRSMAFEKAEIIRKKIEHLENYQSRSVIVNKHITQADVFSMFRDEGGAFINYLMVENGTIVQTHTTEAKTQLEETDEEILAFSIAQLRDRFNSAAPKLFCPFQSNIRRKVVYHRTQGQVIKRNYLSSLKKM